ncbi:RagB/SusD family nutrient uptake outer membrane protein [Flavitalea antarctica]
MKPYQQLVAVMLTLSMIFFNSCKKSFLDVQPTGVLTEESLSSVEKTEDLIVAAYAALGNSTYDRPYVSDYVWGSVRSDDAYKGGSGVADQPNLNDMEQYNTVTPSVATYANNTWIVVYSAIDRVNSALRQLDKFTDQAYIVSGIPNARKVRQAELRFLRAHFMFILKRIFKYPVWIDHTVSQDDARLISNRQYSNTQLWDKIGDDFQFATDNLPVLPREKGRAYKHAATAYLAKVKLYQAYIQNEDHSVTSIDATKLQQVVMLTDMVINSGAFKLLDNYGLKWLYGIENSNNPESIFAVQYSFDDGTTFGRVDFEHGLNYSMAPPYGCCSFHHASQNLVNAFKTDKVSGLPMYENFNNTEMKNPADFEIPVNTVDPRLDHTVGIPSHPFKYDVGFITQPSWSRAPAVYGNFVTMKEIQLPGTSIRKTGPFTGTGKNWDILQYNDVLLMKAEALIELGQQDLARPIINSIRERAAGSTSLITYPVGHPKAGQGFSSYKIATYNGVNLPWTRENARKALQWERRLEFAMESPRFHDLVRWGIAAETLNGYLAVEKTRRPYLATAVFTKGRDEYLPIPQDQINLVDGLYIQNPKY